MSLFDQDINKYDVDRVRIIDFIRSNYDRLYAGFNGFTAIGIDPSEIIIDEKLIHIEGSIVLKNDLEYVLPEDLIKDGWKFGIVNGNFYCESESLISLMGCPSQTNLFSCAGSSITTLRGAPRIVNDDFECQYCKNLKSLDWLPEIIKGDLYCYECDQLEWFSVEELRKYTKIHGTIFDLLTMDL